MQEQLRQKRSACLQDLQAVDNVDVPSIEKDMSLVDTQYEKQLRILVNGGLPAKCIEALESKYIVNWGRLVKAMALARRNTTAEKMAIKDSRIAIKSTANKICGLEDQAIKLVRIQPQPCQQLF